MEEKKINRRDYLKYTGAAIGGLVVGGALGYLAKPSEVVKETVTAPGVISTVTAPAKTLATTQLITTTQTVTATGVPGAVTLTFAEPGDNAETSIKPLLPKWYEEYPEIKVEIMSLPTTADEQYSVLVTRLSGGMGPDIFILDDQWIASFAEAGWLLPIDEYTSKESIRAQYLANVIDTVGTYKGHIWGLPYWPDVHCTFYRKDLLDKYGFEPPETWDDLIKICTTILEKEKDMVGYTWMGKQYEGLICFFLWVLWSFGGEWIDPDGNVRINEPEAVKALQLLYDLIHKYKISPEGVLTYVEEDARMPFHNGRAIFHTNWTYVWGYAQAEDSPIKGKIGVMVNPHLAGQKPASIIGAWFLGINRNAKYLKEVLRFYFWYTSYECEKSRMLYPTCSYISIRKDIYDDEEVLKVWPMAKALYEIEKTAKGRPRHPKYVQLSQALQRYVHAALVGTMEPKQALDKAAEETKNILKSA